MRTAILLIGSWAVGLAAYAGALKGWRGEVLSLDNWMIIGSITLVVWLLASRLVTLPILRRLPSDGSSRSGMGSSVAGGMLLAIVPVWLTLTVWAGWHPRYLLSQEAGLLAVLYGTSGLVLGLSVGSRSRRAVDSVAADERAGTGSVGVQLKPSTSDRRPA